MKSQEPQEKTFRQLSDEELEKVTGGSWTGFGSLEECKDREYICSHQELCKITCPHLS